MKQSIAENLLQPSLDRWWGQGAESYLRITWWAAHPLVTVVTIVVLLVLAQGVLGLVSNVIKQLLLLIVKSPYLLLQWLLAKSSKSLNLPPLTLKTSGLKQKGGTPENLQERLLSALKQLETTQQEQEQVLKELKILLVESQKRTKQASAVQPSTNISANAALKNPRSAGQ